ncbi:MAG: hypothetical protein RL545_528, partial [Actinomycetota bacterium]
RLVLASYLADPEVALQRYQLTRTTPELREREIAWVQRYQLLAAAPNFGANATGTGSCVVNWGVLKKWSKLSKADQKKYKKPLAMKSFTTTKGCSVNPAAKAALAVAGTTFTATSDVLRTRMWPATYLPKKPNNERIAPRLRHLTVTINTN